MKFLIGIDEAGRGPLAGPVAVGAVVVPRDFDFRRVAGARDSKQMSPLAREKMYARLLEFRKAGELDFAVSFSAAATIDRRGIVPAIRSALARALGRIHKVEPCGIEVLLDGGLRAPEVFINQKTIIRGDESEPIISLASIAAKVERDRLMRRLAKKYSAYGLEVHKGYGTRAHQQAILRNGLSGIHRHSFCRRILLTPEI